jgi:hypothetical protein
MKQSRKSQSKTAEPSARAKLSAAFLEALEKDFREYGKSVIEEMRLKDPTRYAELAGKMIMTIEAPSKGFEECNTIQEIGLRLLQNIGCNEADVTEDMIAEAIKANDVMVAELERIRDTALGPMQ